MMRFVLSWQGWTLIAVGYMTVLADLARMFGADLPKNAHSGPMMVTMGLIALAVRKPK